MTVTILIIIVTCLISYKGFNDRSFFEKLKHHPVSEANNGEWYRMVSSGFLHADWFHLGINMYVLYEFGSLVERLYLDQFGEVYQAQKQQILWCYRCKWCSFWNLVYIHTIFAMGRTKIILCHSYSSHYFWSIISGI
jgi:hypothetical protein